MEITYKDEENNYSALTDVYFKIHYFIYDRPIYYGDRISGPELKKFKNCLKPQVELDFIEMASEYCHMESLKMIGQILINGGVLNLAKSIFL